MNRNYLFSFFFILSIITAISNYLGYVSIVEQKYLLSDLNNNKSELDLMDALSFNTTYPNITITSIPISALISMYLIKEGNFQLAIEKLKTSVKFNPYIMFNESLLADTYIRMYNFDSAYHYSKKAFKKVPNNSRHFGFFVKSASALEKHKEIRESFETIKNNNDPQFWEMFSAYLYNNKEKLNDTINYVDSFFVESSQKYPNNMKIDMIKKFIKLGEEKVRKSIQYSDFAKKSFEEKKYFQAIENYKKSFEIDSLNFKTLENLVVSYYQSNNFKEALKYSDLYLKNFNDIESEKVGLIFSLSNHRLGNNDVACKYLEKMTSKNSPNARIYFNKICRK